MGAILCKYRFEVRVSRWWTQNRRNTGSRKRLLELRDERRKRRLIAFEHQQTLRSKAQNLPAEFQPHRSAGACDQHPFPRQYGWQRGGGGQGNIRGLEQRFAPLSPLPFRKRGEKPI